ncbi:MAG: hypothetical protein ACLRIS_19630 [Flavonifractor plautii]
MVRELTRERTEDFQTACAYERVFGSEILTLLRVYGLEDDQVRFYLEEQEGRPAAAIALQDRALWVSVRPGTGVEDLAVLAQSIDGLLEVNGDLAIAQALHHPGRRIDSSVYMVYRGDAAGHPGRLGTREEVLICQRGHLLPGPPRRRWAEEMAASRSWNG